MNLGLTGKRALVLASSSGLGFACAQALAEEGATVAICSREQTRANEAAVKIEAATDAKVFAYEVDVSKAESLASLFKKATSDLGGLDILICNAGGPPPGGFSALDEDKWDFAYQLHPAKRCQECASRAAAPQRKRWLYPGDWQLFNETAHPQPDALQRFPSRYSRSLQNFSKRTRP